MLARALSSGVAALDWEQTTFAYADVHDGERWLDVRTAQHVTPTPGGLLVRPDSLPPPADTETDGEQDVEAPPGSLDQPGEGDDPPPDQPPAGSGPTQFYAEFQLDPVRCIKELADIAEHVTARLGPDVELTLEVRAKNSDGFDEATRRTVSENSANLGSKSSEFE